MNSAFRMEKNVGRVDRYLRISIGSFLLAMGSARMVRYGDMGGAMIGLLGGMTLAEGILGTCPYYSLMGINTTQQEYPEPGHYTNDLIQPYEGI